jgi:hypothetical protein
VPIPNYYGFALVRYTDARNIVRTKAALLHGFFNNLECPPNDLHRIVLDPPRTRKDLFVFPLSHGHHAAAAIEHHEASAGGALIQCRDVSSLLRRHPSPHLPFQIKKKAASCLTRLAEVEGGFLLMVFTAATCI